MTLPRQGGGEAQSQDAELQGLSLARAQVTDYGQGSVREAYTQRTLKARARRLSVHCMHVGHSWSQQMCKISRDNRGR